MGFTSMDDWLNKTTVLGQKDEFAWHKIGGTAEAAGVWQTLWTSAGCPGAPTSALHAATPGAALTSIPGGAVEGSLYYANQLTATKHIITAAITATQDAVLMIYDRLYGCQFSLAAAGAQNINPTASIALPRYADGRGVEAWVEIVTTTGSPTITATSYTNEAGTGARAGTISLAATPVIGSMYQMRLAAGDLGVRSVQTVTVGTNTASTANLILLRPLAFIPAPANNLVEVDFINKSHALDRVYDGATLGFAYLASATTAATFHGHIRLAWG